MIYLLKAKLEGGHWNVSFASAPAANRTFALGGRVVFREGDDWDHFALMLRRLHHSPGVGVILEEYGRYGDGKSTEVFRMGDCGDPALWKERESGTLPRRGGTSG